MNKNKRTTSISIPTKIIDVIDDVVERAYDDNRPTNRSAVATGLIMDGLKARKIIVKKEVKNVDD